MAEILLLYGFQKKRLASPKESPFWRRKEARLTAIIACVVLLLVFSGRIKVSPPFDLPPGGVHQVEGRLILFLERMPGAYNSWQTANPSGFYYVLGPLTGLVLIFSAGAAFLLFEERKRTKWVRFLKFFQVGARHGTVNRPTRREDFL
jgi:hypothetical protein